MIVPTGELSVYLLREAGMDDVGAILALARHLNTINLPPEEGFIRELVSASLASFAGGDDPSRFDAGRIFVFVLEAPDGSVVGSSAVHAQHGTPEAPHVFFRVSEEERYAALEPEVTGEDPVPRHMRHRVLQLGQTFEGPSEVGGLILDPSLRKHPERLGRLLSIGRFVYVAGQRSWFRDRMLAELLPPLERDEAGAPHSSLWDALGSKFTGLEYAEADQLSRRDKRFIHRLFPRAPIYASLLPEAAQEVIGRVGPSTRGAQRLLAGIGFEDSGKVDPFDGGPHYEGDTSELQPVRESSVVSFSPEDPGPEADEHYLAHFSQSWPHVRVIKAAAGLGGAALGEGPLRVGPAVYERLAAAEAGGRHMACPVRASTTSSARSS